MTAISETRKRNLSLMSFLDDIERERKITIEMAQRYGQDVSFELLAKLAEETPENLVSWAKEVRAGMKAEMDRGWM